jgi:uncharacterized membrane protein YdfJ with MMPL/SSD domain
MTIRITTDNLDALRNAMQEVTQAWEALEDDVDTWLEFQESPPTNTDDREEKRQARENIDSLITDLEVALHDAVELFT